MKNILGKGSWAVTLPLVGVALAYLFLVYLPSQRADAELQQQLKEQQEYLAGAKAINTAMQTTVEQLQGAEAYQMRWAEHAPSERTIGALYEKMHLLARAQGVTITRFDPQAVVAHAYLVELPVSLGCTGQFAEIATFLAEIESLPEEIWVSGLRMEEMEADRQSVSCELDLVVFAANSENSGYDESAD